MARDSRYDSRRTSKASSSVVSDANLPIGASGPIPPALLTYAGSEPLLASPFCAHVLSSIQTQLPIDQIPAPFVKRTDQPPSASGVWRPAPPPKELKPLPTQLVELGTHLTRVQAETDAFIAPSHALSYPLAHLYLLVCDDVEHYRTSVRDDIHRWLNVLRHTHGLKLQPAEIPHNGLKPAPPFNDTSAAAAAAATAAAAEVDASTPVLDTDEEPEWLVVLIAPADSNGADAAAASSGAKRLYSSFQKGVSVVDKLKADFGAPHVVQLTRLPPLFPPAAMGRSGVAAGVDPGMFADLMVSLRVSCAKSLQTLVTAQESILARTEAVHNTLLLHATGGALDRFTAHKSWDFSSWMLAKDYLARTLHALGLLDDAWVAYDDIDAVVSYACDRIPGGGDAHPFFYSLGGLRQGLDTETILDPRGKPYREMLQRGRMTLFDCRVFVFAARSRILAQMGGLPLVRLLRDADTFFSATVRNLTVRQTMPKAYLASWQYSNSLDVVENCTQWWSTHEANRLARPPAPRSVSADLEKALGRESSQPGTPTVTESDSYLESAFNAGKALLLSRARAQLELLGVENGLLPRLSPFEEAGMQSFANSLGETQTVYDDQDHKLTISNEGLDCALRSESVFDIRYSTAIETEMAAWMQARKTSAIMSLRSRLGCLALVRRRYKEALDTFDALAASYAEEGMNVLAEEHLVLWLTAYDALLAQGEKDDAVTDAEWVPVAVRLLNARSLLSDRSRGVVPTKRVAHDSPWRQDEHVWSRLRTVEPPEQANDDAEERHVINGFAAFTLRAASNAASTCDDEDGALLPVRVQARIAQPLEVDSLRLRVRNAQRPPVWFSSDERPTESEGAKAVVLETGENVLSLFASAPPTGRYVVDRAQIVVGAFVFDYNLPVGPLDPVAAPALPGAPAPSTGGNQAAQLVNLPEDGDALYATLTLPEDIVLDAPRMVELALHAGRNHVQTAEMALLTLQGASVPIPDAQLAGVTSDSASTLPEEEGSTRLTAVADAPRVQVHDLRPRTVARVLLPLDPILEAAPASGPGAMVHVQLHIDYITKSRPEVSRALSRRVDLRTALPIGVSVQDFFVLTSLFSKFAVLAGGNDALRVRSAQLESVDGQLTISGPPDDQPTVVTPTQPASFVFRMEPSGAPMNSKAEHNPLKDKEDAIKNEGDESISLVDSEPTGSLKLTLYFRSLAEEARWTMLSLLEQHIAKLDPDHKLLSHARRTCLRRALGRLVEDRLDASRYALTGEILLGPFSLRAWQITCDRWGVPPVTPAKALTPAESEGQQAIHTERDAVLTVVQSALNDAASGSSAGDQGAWRRLILSVDPPRTAVVAAVDVNLGPGPLPLLVGIPRTAQITIRTWTGWSGQARTPPPEAKSLTTTNSSKEVGDPDPKWELTYEVWGAYDTWLVSGEVRGALPLPRLDAAGEAQVHEHTIQVKLIPVKHGALLLPNVSVAVHAKPHVSDAGEATPTTQAEQAEQAEQAALAWASAAVGAPTDATPPTCETWQANGAERVEVVPRRSRATVYVDLPNGSHWSAQPGTRFVPA